MSQLLDPPLESPGAAAGASAAAALPATAASEPGCTAQEPVLPTSAEPSTPHGVCPMHSSAACCARRELPLDLFGEGAGNWALSLRQSRCLTPLTLSSRAARDLLRQF